MSIKGLKFLTVLVIVFYVFLGSVVWAGEKGDKHPIDVWLDRCIEKSKSVNGRVNCVIQKINDCVNKKSSTVEIIDECLYLGQKYWNKIIDNKEIQKAVFKDFKEISKNKKYINYANYVWKYWVMKETNNSDLKMFRISKDNIALIITDLNDDGYEDMIATIINNNYFCGKFGSDCEFKVFINNRNGGFYQIESEMSVLVDLPIYIISDKVNGLKKIIVNGRFIMEFDGKRYFRVKN